MTDKVENGTTKATTPAVEEPLPASVLDKYKAAALVSSSTLKTLVPLLVEGANVLELVSLGSSESENGF